jgi:hypothetical protein
MRPQRRSCSAAARSSSIRSIAVAPRAAVAYSSAATLARPDADVASSAMRSRRAAWSKASFDAASSAARSANRSALAE